MLIDHLDVITSRRLRIIDEGAVLRSAARSLSEPGTEMAVVCNGRGAVAGVLTKSDLVRHLAEAGCGDSSPRDLMTRAVVSCKPQDDLHSVWANMVDHGLQTVPVVDAHGKPLGVLDIRDAMRALLDLEELQAHMLVNYIVGIGYR